MAIPEALSQFFHKPDGSEEDINATNVRRGFYKIITALSLIGTPISLPFVPDAAAVIRNEVLFLAINLLLLTFARPGNKGK